MTSYNNDIYQRKIDAFTEEIEVIVTLLRNKSIINNQRLRKQYLEKIDTIAEEIQKLKLKRIFDGRFPDTHHAA